MPRLFNVVRASIFAAALLFAIIVLGIAAYLDSILEPSNLTRFVSIALAVSVITILCTATILFFGSRRRDTFITHTRWEVALTSIMGILWLVLALFMSLQPLPDVDCPEDSNGDAADYTTDEFHAQYHALQAFAVLELILLCGWAIFLFTLAMRHSLAGRKQVWNARVNEAPWFAPRAAANTSPDDKFTRLPPPISSRPKHSRGFSTPVTFFTRRYNNDGNRPPLRRDESQSSLSTAESGEPIVSVLPVRERANTGTGFTHARGRSEPIPAVFGTAATKTNPYAATPVAMPARPTMAARATTGTAAPAPPPKSSPRPSPPQRSASESRPSPYVPAGVTRSGSSGAPKAKGSPTAAAATAAAPVMRSASGSAPAKRPTYTRAGSSSRAVPTPAASPPQLERRPTTTRPPVVYVPTPASTRQWQRSPPTSSDNIAASMPPIAAAMMKDKERERGRPPTAGPSTSRGRAGSASQGRKGSTSRDRGAAAR